MAKKKLASASVEARMKSSAREASPTTIENLRTAVRKQRDLKKQIEDAEEVLKALNVQLYDLEHKELPELFIAAGVDHVGLPKEGNLPAYDARLSPYYHANIGAKWDDKRKAAAFKHLADKGYGDIVKTEVVTMFGMGERTKAQEVLKELKKLKVVPSVSLAVPWNTLTAIVREEYKNGKITLDPVLIGAEVGNVVNLKERKDV